MSRFFQALAPYRDAPGSRRWIYVPYDQLSDGIGPLATLPPNEAGLVLVESTAKAGRRPYHQQKLALVLTSQRHFALEQAARGVAVRYLVTDHSYAHPLRELVSDIGPLEMMRPAERELRAELADLVATGALVERPHEGWLTTADDFQRASPGPPWRMDAFYPVVRRRTGLLMQRGRPLGGRWSFDTENRRRWPGTPEAPAPPTFRPDDITAEVVDLVKARFGSHPGTPDGRTLPASADQVARLWTWAREACLEHFGPFEDAMSTASRGLFHTRISPLLNLHRLLPRQVVADVADDERLPLSSREGFVRQVLGWREFVRHVHEATDGFRRIGTRDTPLEPAHGGAAPNLLDATRPLPAAYWGTPSGLFCLDTVVREVWEDGWSHHITRLMVLANLATLLDVSPRELTDWFWVAYVDAYDWVVEPNVLAMGTFAVGDVMTTKPYVAGAAYISRMSDYCQGCAFDPGTTCPITPLYWAFLARHADALERNPRMRLIMQSLRRRSPAQRTSDAAVFARVSDAFAQGRVLAPRPDASAV